MAPAVSRDRRAVAAFDIDLLHFDPASLLRYDVCIASGVVDPPPTLVIDYLREKVDPACDYMIYSEMGGVYFFQFLLTAHSLKGDV